MLGNDLEELQKIGLISKVCAELDNHLGFSDKTLAEFIIHLAETNQSVGAFHQKLLENGAEFPESFSSNIHRIISQSMKQSNENAMKITQGSKAPLVPSVPRSSLDIEFPALARPNSIGAIKFEDLPNEQPEWIKKLKEADIKLEKTISNEYPRKRNRSRSSSPLRQGRDAKAKIGSNQNRSEPELYGIYDGKVTNILDFGCFVELAGFHRKEGLVHIAQIQQVCL